MFHQHIVMEYKLKFTPDSNTCMIIDELESRIFIKHFDEIKEVVELAFHFRDSVLELSMRNYERL